MEERTRRRVRRVRPSVHAAKRKVAKMSVRIHGALTRTEKAAYIFLA